MTKAQKKALAWLSEQGGSSCKAGRMGQALASLEMIGMAKGGWGAHGPRGGWCVKWELTEKGKAAIESGETP